MDTFIADIILTLSLSVPAALMAHAFFCATEDDR
jgi:hypothetical protein